MKKRILMTQEKGKSQGKVKSEIQKERAGMNSDHI